MKTQYTIPFFIIHQGCPFTCIFCSQNKISGKEDPFPPSLIPSTISRYLKTIPQKANRVEVGFFGGSFTGLTMPKQEAYLKKVQPFLQKGKVHGIRLSTRPDFINQDALDLLKKYNVSCVELGIQSISDAVLKAAKRGHTRKDIERASRLILKNNLILGHQIMIGLPKSTFAQELKTAKVSVTMGASQVRIYPVIVIKGTELGKMYKHGLYTPLEENEAIERCAKLVRFFEKNHVKVIRCGLHPSTGLATGKDILKGPFHPAFRQRVETYLYADLFKKHIRYNDKLRPIRRIIYNPREAASVIGYKRINANYVESLLGKGDLLKSATSVPIGKLKFEYKDGRSLYISKL